MKYFTLILIIFNCHLYGQSVFSGFYPNNIPTSFSNPPVHDPACNGSTTKLDVILPAGPDKQVTKVTVSYNMTASVMFPANKSEQRSKIYCQNTTTEEENWAVGIGLSGTQVYSRDINIANGTFPGGTTLTFEMRAVRTNLVLDGCNAAANRVDAGTWQIEVHYEEVYAPVSKVGVNEENPSVTLDVNGKIKVADDTESPVAGAIRYNSVTQDFEGYDGSQWKSFTKSNGQSEGGWGKVIPNHENQKVHSNDGNEYDYFGESVAIDGNYAAIGSYRSDIGPNIQQGAVYIFIREGNQWVQQAKLIANDGAAVDWFGKSVSISGEYVIVGAMLDDLGPSVDAGSAYIFKRFGNTWTQQVKLTASDFGSSIFEYFGAHVSIHGDYAIISAYHKDIGPIQRQGAAYIFVRNGVTWTEQTRLTVDDGQQTEYFGWGVSIYNNYVAIGAYHNDEVAVDAGAAYIFVRSGNSWTQQAKLKASDGSAGDHFGFSVSLHGDYVVVGARMDDDNGQNSGSAYIFKRNGVQWVQQAKITPSDGTADQEFGTAVSIHGDDIVVGVPRDKLGNNISKGSAYIFTRNGNNWNQQAKLGPSIPLQDNGYFGNTVSISGNFVLIGNSTENTNFEDQGAAYFYNK